MNATAKPAATPNSRLRTRNSGGRRLAAAGTAALGLGAFTATLLHYSRKWVEPPRVMLDPPRSKGIEEVFFTTSDGVLLYGWFFDAGEHRPAVIVAHGYQRSIEETFPLGFDLRERGFSTLVFDFRGCGRSGGRFTSLGYHETRDARAAIHWLRARVGHDAPLGMLGISMGAAVALVTAARCPGLRAVVADSAFATLKGAVDARLVGLGAISLFFHRLTMRTAERLARANIEAVRPVDDARRLHHCPVLLIHGTADTIVPLRHALELDAALAGPHELWTVENAEHTMARFMAREAYLERVSNFLERHLGVHTPVMA